MNAVEIEHAVSELCEAPFDRNEFPYQFLEAFGEKQTTIKRLRKGATNKSDIPGGLLLRNNVHLLGSEPGQAGDDLKRLVESPETTKHKAKFAVATDGTWVEAENLVEGETLACSLKDLPDHFGFFLALAGIATIKQIRDNAFDIKATGRMNSLYVELQQNNPDWDTGERREELNHFFARLTFCFFAEDTGIFPQKDIFTSTVQKMSDPDASNTHEIISEVFRAMNVDEDERERAGLPRYASSMPYVNGGLFEGSTECPKFTKIARSYFIHIGGLDWTKINPDIFGSMIQAVAEDEERGELGMHYTSVPNILKVLNPLFLDELHQQLEDAEDNKRKLLNLRNRMARIRVFDPACGSGNFLVVAYKEMRQIEAEISRRRGETHGASNIPLTNFRGIEIRSFAAEVARLALVIAKFQSDLDNRGVQLALSDVLPLSKSNWITCGNALRINWMELCPPTASHSRITADDLFETPLDQVEIDFENEGGEVFICGNPPYKGRNKKSDQERRETDHVFGSYPGTYSSLDYVANWFIVAAEYCRSNGGRFAFVATSSVCQGEQVALLWPNILDMGLAISFAHLPFEWKNLARDSAGVTVVVVGLSSDPGTPRLYEKGRSQTVNLIGPYLVPGSSVVVRPTEHPISPRPILYLGNMAKDGGHLLMPLAESRRLRHLLGDQCKFLRPFFGSAELIHAQPRACLWIDDVDIRGDGFEFKKEVRNRIDGVRAFRGASKAPSTRRHASTPHRFVQVCPVDGNFAAVIPRVSSQRRPYLPVGLLGSYPVIGDKCFACFEPPQWVFAVLTSTMHRVWIGTVCNRLRADFSYGNRTGWNTFPLPHLTAENDASLAESSERILLARESYWPSTLADMYDPDRIDTEFPLIREAHEHNDEVFERIYIGRRFKNDTERLEKLFEMYEAAGKKGASV